MNGEISTGALRCSTRRKTRAQKTLLSRLLSSLIFILSAVPLVASAQNRASDRGDDHTRHAVEGCVDRRG